MVQIILGLLSWVYTTSGCSTMFCIDINYIGILEPVAHIHTSLSLYFFIDLSNV